MRRLIVNADDLGITDGVNRAITEAHRNGIVTSATLMANGGRFLQAIDLLQTTPHISIGCHVVLVDGIPMTSADRVPSLCAEGTSSFPLTFGNVAQRAIAGKFREPELELEIATQIETLQNAGVNVTHVDSHKHVHMLPEVGRALIKTASAFGVRAIRNPFVPLKPLMLGPVLKRPNLWARYAQTKLLRAYHRQFRRLVTDAGMVTTDGSFGVVSTGFLDGDLFRAIAASIPDGTWEFVCHPGYVDDQLNAVRTRLRSSRERELAILTSEDARQALAEHGIELISFRDLAANVRV